MKKVIFPVALILMLVSCTNPGIKSRLGDIAGYLNEKPDSALAALEEIPAKRLGTPGVKAKHALLYSIALDKNYIDVADDSTINVAVRYYKKHGTDRDKMLAYYYLGRIHENSGNYTQSIVAFTNALVHAEQANDSFYKGLIYRGFADIYGQTFNHTEELRYRQLEYDSFMEAGAIRYAYFALKGSGNAYASTHEFVKSEECYSKAVEYAQKCRDTSLLCNALLDYAHLFTYKDYSESEMTIDIYSYVVDTLNQNLSLYDYITLASACYQNGNIEQAEEIIQDIRPYIAKDKTLEAIFKLEEYRIAMHHHNYKGAIEALDYATQIQDSLYHYALNHSVMAAQRDFLKQQLEYEEYRSISSRTISALIIAISLLIILFLTYYAYRKVKQKENELSNYMRMLESSRSTLQKYEQQMSDYSQKISDFSHQIGRLYQTKFDLIGGICQKYYEHENMGNRQKFVYKEVESVIDKLKEDNESALLETILNENKDGIMTRLRNDEELKFKPHDYLLLEYWFADFSPSVMSLLLGKRIDTVYNMRSRIRTRIRNSHSQYKDLYLSNITND